MSVALRVEVPVACFRQSRAREYAETYPVPPPSTVYGMLLSLVGEMDRFRHVGAELAIGMLSQPKTSTVIRTFRRLKKKELLDPSNARPDYQELLTDIRFVVHVFPGPKEAAPTLSERLRAAFAAPDTVVRFGGLSLGESRDLVDIVALIPEGSTEHYVRWLCKEEDGLMSLPVWVDHVGARFTRWNRYDLMSQPQAGPPPQSARTEIAAPEVA